MLLEMDPSLTLPSDIRGDLLLSNSGLTRAEQLLVLTATDNSYDFDKISKVLLVQHPSRGPASALPSGELGKSGKGKWRRKGKGKGKGKAKGKGKFGQFRRHKGGKGRRVFAVEDSENWVPNWPSESEAAPGSSGFLTSLACKVRVRVRR